MLVSDAARQAAKYHNIVTELSGILALVFHGWQAASAASNKNQEHTMKTNKTRPLIQAAVYLCAMSCWLSCSALQAEPVWISVEQSTLQAVNALQVLQQQALTPVQANNLHGHQVALVQVDSEQLPLLSAYLHEEKQRCGGFFAYSSLQEAQQALSQPLLVSSFTAPPLSQASLVNAALPQLNQAAIAQFISDLSQFTNRYYTTTSGKNAADWIAQQWTTLAAGKSFAKVSRVSHSGYNQQSVLLELTGSERPQDIVVLGGHLDSIVSGGMTESTRAPGADDDASGIATLTEIAKVLVQSGYRPKRTIRFYGYAAEEVGLRGSKDIANAVKAAGSQVLAVLQLDMTNYKGGVDDIVLMTDYTNANLNSYLASLISTYQPSLKQSTDQCGYGCSDHASWHNAGFAAAFPFEARFASSNNKIHTVNDTLANSDQTAVHALKFARLGLSFALELGNSVGGTPPGNSGSEANLAAASGQWLYRTIVVPAGRSSLTVSISGGTGDADLYLRSGSNPTTSQYQCRPYKAGNNETCTINNPQAGNWMVGLRGYSAFSAVNLNWQQQ